MFLFWLAAVTVMAHASGITPESFQEKLDRASQLNTTAPWRESQAILDELKPDLAQANPDQYAEFAYLEARNRVLSGDLDSALKQLDALLEREMDVRQKIRVFRLAANVSIIARRFEEAFDYLSDGLKLMEAPEQEPLSEGLYSLASYAYAQVGEVERGLEYGRLAVRLAKQTGALRAQCSAEQRLAFVNKIEGNLDQARHYYTEARQHCIDAGDDLITGVVECGLADLLRGAGEFDQAEQLFEKGLERLIRVEYESGIAEARLYYARLEKERGRFDRVKRLLTPAIDQLAVDQTWDYLAEAHHILADIARDEGDDARAIMHYEARMNAREKHLDMERARRIAFLEVEFDLRHTEQQLALLREQARVNDLQQENRRQQWMLSATGYTIAVALVAILILLLLRSTRERRRYQSLSHRDGLTGVNNHTRFFEIAGTVLAGARERDRPFTLILADIDHFKQVNDRHGHLAGDDVLRRVGARLRECFGHHGDIGRIGGEEFAIALPNISPVGVQPLLERFRRSLQQIRDGDAPIPVTMSFGIASSKNPAESLTEMRERADRALYEAKNSGRNRVVLADDNAWSAQ